MAVTSVTHALAPLTPAEIARAVALVKAAPESSEHLRFVMVKLHEPPVSPQVVGQEPGAAVPREVFFSLLEKVDGVGLLANSLELGCDCLGEIRYFDAHMTENDGSVRTLKNAVCLHEEDDGLLWKHTNYRTEHVEVMPVAQAGFLLRPANFFTGNPALDHQNPITVVTAINPFLCESSRILESACFAANTKEDRFIESCPDLSGISRSAPLSLLATPLRG